MNANKPIARGILPDALTDEHVIILKAPSFLRLTNEIRMATFFAAQSGRRLRLVLRAGSGVSARLKAFLAKNAVIVERNQ